MSGTSARQITTSMQALDINPVPHNNDAPHSVGDPTCKPSIQTLLDELNAEAHLTDEEYAMMVYPRYKPRAQTFTSLPAKYDPSPENPKPPVLNYGIPVTSDDLFKYATWAGKVTYFKLSPDQVSPRFLWSSVEVLSDSVIYPLILAEPYFTTPKCHFIVSLYSNYNYKEKQLVDEDEENVIDAIKGELELDSEVKPMWYFDVKDPWRPGDPVD